MPLPPYLQYLETQAVEILREVMANYKRPVLLYSIGKDSSVLLHLARKAVFPSTLPFPLLHVDTGWKFREMIEFRDKIVKKHNLTLIIEENKAAKAEGINPFDHDATSYTHAFKTVPLKAGLKKGRFDVAIGGARRDEEKSRAKERIFSLRSQAQGWNPKDQRPELGTLAYHHLQPQETMRAFPLSNWTEQDIWAYILHENIEIVDLYFAKPRPVVKRGNTFLVVDDQRFKFKSDEMPQTETVRFRTLGCYPLTGAVQSTAKTLAEIVEELLSARVSERQGRLIDFNGSSMEAKKREGYF